MIRCPGCGAETDPQMTTCWECHEPLDNAHSHKDDLEFGPEDDDDDIIAPARSGKDLADNPLSSTNPSASPGKPFVG